jgi:hypothetical protein
VTSVRHTTASLKHNSIKTLVSYVTFLIFNFRHPACMTSAIQPLPVDGLRFQETLGVA